MPTALDIAVQLVNDGFPVFPCGSNKRPSIPGPGGHNDASLEMQEVQRLFSIAAKSAVMVGVPTGERSGFDVLDVDYRSGGRVWESYHADNLPETRIHSTVGGGRHYLFKHAHGVCNSQSKIAKGVDIRGEGGYAIMPPSPGYDVISDADIAEWPDWLLAEVLSRPTRDDIPAFDGPREKLTSARLEGLTKSILARVSSAADGTKHSALRNAALSLGGILEQANISQESAVSMLIQALPSSVKDYGNAKKTAEWGIERGRERPLELPDRPGYERSYEPPPMSMDDYGAVDSVVVDTQGRPFVAEPESSRPPIEVLWFDDIEATLDTKDFVQGLLIEGSAGVVYGASNSGKTFWTTDLGLHIAAGLDWNGRRVEQGGVLYCALEGGIGFRNRVAAWKDAHGLASIPFLAVTSPLNLRDPEGDTERLITVIEQAKAKMQVPLKLVIIDTLSRAMAGGNENAPEDMGALVMCMDRLRAATSAAEVFIHHTGKDQAKGARGHSLLQAAIDTEIEVIAPEVGEIHTATVVKQRELHKGDIFAFTLKVVELGKNRHNEPVTTCLVEHGEEGAAAPARRYTTGNTKRAMEVLADLLATAGEAGHRGTPTGYQSVPEKWWRERFYDRAMPGAEDEAKKKAFRRVADSLVADKSVGMAGGRVWLPYQNGGHIGGENQ